MKHESPQFIEKRRSDLEEFMQGLMKVPALHENLFFLDFFDMQSELGEILMKEERVTILDINESKLKFDMNASPDKVWGILSDWNKVDWKGKVDKLKVKDQLRKYTLPSPWGEVRERLLECEQDEKGGGKIIIETLKSDMPLRSLVTTIELKPRAKGLKTKVIVSLRSVPDPSKKAKDMKRIVEENTKSQFLKLLEQCWG